MAATKKYASIHFNAWIKGYKHPILFCVLLLIAVLPSCKGQSTDSVSALFEKQIFTNKQGFTIPYRLMRPAKIENGKRYPLVMFYHGAGERGWDNYTHLNNGVKVFMKDNYRKDFPCFVIAAQCPSGLRWVDTDWHLDFHKQPDTPSLPLRLSMELMDSLLSVLPIDTNRLYVTGLSMGGFATWDILSRYPNKFAAGVPVCGGGDEHTANLLIHTPIWAFHGCKDELVKTKRTENMINALIKSGGHPRYTYYEKIAHNCWVAAYNDTALIPWLFSQKRHY